MRILLEEVVLDLPRVIDADPVGKLDLIERILEQLQLVAVVPRPRQLMLVEDAEFHGAFLFLLCGLLKLQQRRHFALGQMDSALLFSLLSKAAMMLAKRISNGRTISGCVKM